MLNAVEKILLLFPIVALRQMEPNGFGFNVVTWKFIFLRSLGDGIECVDEKDIIHVKIDTFSIAFTPLLSPLISKNWYMPDTGALKRIEWFH